MDWIEPESLRLDCPLFADVFVWSQATECLPDHLHEGELRGPVDGDIKVEFAFCSANLVDVYVEVANRIRLERLLGRFVPIDIGKPAEAMALQTPAQ